MQRALPLQHFRAQLPKRDIPFPRNYVIREANDLLLLRLVAHLRPAKYDDHVRPHALQVRHHCQRLRRVPDVDADADDLRLRIENALDDIHRPLRNIKLQHPRAIAQLRRQVRHKVAQPE